MSTILIRISKKSDKDLKEMQRYLEKKFNVKLNRPQTVDYMINFLPIKRKGKKGDFEL